MKADFLNNGDKKMCCGCGSCAQKCLYKCITLKADEEGFLYPEIDKSTCVNCGLCRVACPLSKDKSDDDISDAIIYGGYIKNDLVRASSSSGGAFTALAESFCDEEYVIFGAEMDDEFNVFHSYIESKAELDRFRKSKYLQSDMRNTYTEVKSFLDKGKKVLFSGTPCEIAGLNLFLNKSYENLLTVDVLCHSVPTVKWFNKEKEWIEKKSKCRVCSVDFRNKDNATWDRYRMVWRLENNKQKTWIKDPFIVAWNAALISRPSCYDCRFACKKRVSDVTIGDLWGVHKFASHLYGENKGVSFFLLNTEKGAKYFDKIKDKLVYDKVSFDDVAANNPRLLRPMEWNEKRDQFIRKMDTMTFGDMMRLLPKTNYFSLIVCRILSRETKNKLSRILKRIKKNK